MKVEFRGKMANSVLDSLGLRYLNARVCLCVCVWGVGHTYSHEPLTHFRPIYLIITFFMRTQKVH